MVSTKASLEVIFVASFLQGGVEEEEEPTAAEVENLK